MKVFVLSVAALGIVAVSAWGQGSAVILRERARNLANQNNGANQNTAARPPATPATAPAAPAATPPSNPALTATLQNVADLQSNLSQLETNAAVKTQLIANLNAAAADRKPSTNSISKLADDLAAALAGRKLPQDQQKKLAQYCHAIANGSHLSPMQQQTVFGEMQKILQTAQVPTADATKIITDMKTIVRESQ